MLLDRELKPKYQLVAKATDGGGHFCQVDIIIDVEDMNDNSPRFFPSHCAVAVFDNTTVKTPIAVVFARDPDEGKSECGVYTFYCITISTDTSNMQKQLTTKGTCDCDLMLGMSGLLTAFCELV